MSRRKEPAIPADLLDQLLAGTDAATALDQGCLLDSLKKALAERALNAEMDHHLGGEAEAGNNRNGYGRKTVITDSGKIEIDVPRDRAGSFDPQLIAKYQRHFPAANPQSGDRRGAKPIVHLASARHLRHSARTIPSTRGMPFMPSIIRPLLLIASMAAALAGGPLAAQGTRAPRSPASAAPAPAPVATAPDLSRAAFIATMDAQFRAQDPNNDGKLTRAEIEGSERAKTLATAQATNRQLFAQLDLDRNGVLYPQEFAGLVQQPPLPDVAPVMTRLDGNRDQVVTLVEYRAATLANFDRLDTDHDGIVTGAEMRAGGLAPTGR